VSFVRVLAVVLIVVVVAAASVASAGSTATADPMLVASMPSAARAFAVGPGRIAWIDAQRRAHILRLSSWRRTTIAYTAVRSEVARGGEVFAVEPGLAFAGSRPVWADAWREPIAGQRLLENVYERLYATTATGRLRAVAQLHHEDDGGGGPGGYLLSIAGDTSGGAYSWVRGTTGADNSSFRSTGGGVWTLANGISRRVPNLPPAWALARSGSRLALAPIAVYSSIPAPEGDSATPTVVIATLDGKLVAKFRTKYDVQSLALTSRYLFVYVADENGGALGVEIHDARTGKLLRWLSRLAAPYMSASGRYAVFSTHFDSVWLLDGTTGAIRRVAKTNYGRSRIIEATISQRAVWWAVATKTPGSHGDTDNPADFVTSIHRDVLPE
jgi:hypothetical protein